MKKQMEAQGWIIVDSIGNDTFENIAFEAGGKLFVATKETLAKIHTIYRAYRDGSEIILLPGYKTGKSFATVRNFVESRTS